MVVWRSIGPVGTDIVDGWMDVDCFGTVQMRWDQMRIVACEERSVNCDSAYSCTVSFIDWYCCVVWSRKLKG